MFPWYIIGVGWLPVGSSKSVQRFKLSLKKKMVTLNSFSSPNKISNLLINVLLQNYLVLKTFS
jgi:hypothetical protein